MKDVRLEPKIVFDCFAKVNQIPRPSTKEEKIIAFLKDFGKNLNLDTRVDEIGNVIIRKPATSGYENLEKLIIQSHMDMVCEKNADVDFNFMTDAIQTEIKGEWLHAKGTTLGADDGIGVAMQMALLQSNDIEHGPIECVFTRNEEQGLEGAIKMKSDFMTGKYLVNLDSEDEGQIFISCAGGANTDATYTCIQEEVPDDYVFFKVEVKGLTGGHSGDDINKMRANANKILVRYLYNCMKKYDLRISEIQSGGLHNAIPREGYAIIAVQKKKKEPICVDLNILRSEIEEEFHTTEKNFEMTLGSTDARATVISQKAAIKMIQSLHAAFNGVFANSQDIDLVETSSNLARIKTEGSEVLVCSSQRSSLMSARKNVTSVVCAALELGGAKTKVGEGYPGWKFNPNSKLLKIAKESYMRLFNKEPKVLAIHAGLECGLFSKKYPHLDMVSFGPTLRAVHSPDECLLIPSVQMVWDHLKDILVNIPKIEKA